jgi:Holliday junction resolvase RusA-like endonuclease
VTSLIKIESTYFPPSTNSLFANVAGRGRVRTKRYREWAAAAGWDLQGKGSIPGPFVIDIILSRKKRRSNADLDNHGTKAILDLLVSHKIIEDDSLAEKISIEWGDCEGFYLELRPYFRPL